MARQRRATSDDTLELVPEPREFPPTIHRVERRPFGIRAVPLLCSLSSLALLAALALLVSGTWSWGIVLVALSLACVALLAPATRREPDSRLVRVTTLASDRLRSVGRLVVVSVKAWAKAALPIVRLRVRELRLRHELRDHFVPLGEAVYEDDQQRIERLKREAQEIESNLRDADRQTAEAMAAARQQVTRERATSQATQNLPAVQREDVSLHRDDVLE